MLERCRFTRSSDAGQFRYGIIKNIVEEEISLFWSRTVEMEEDFWTAEFVTYRGGSVMFPRVTMFCTVPKTTSP